MKKYELKHGDLVKLSYNGEIARAYGMGYGTILNSKGGYEALENAEPIPLTTDILEKNSYAFYDKYHCWMSEEKKVILGQADDGSLHYDIKEVKYVHELQHILWALGVDDDIKL